jgi:MFS family permease
LVEVAGAVRIVRAGGLVAAAGFGLGLVTARPAAALVGFACLGAGMASIVPIVFRAAGSVPGLTAGIALAAVSSVGYLGFVVGPPIIGGVAEVVGLPAALGALVVLALAVAGLAPTTAATRAPGAASEPAPEPARA